MNFTNPDISVLKNKKLFIFDMDGTIYLGSLVFEFAVDFIKKLRKNGKRVLFFTNNASRSAKTYLERLEKMGFEPSESEIMTSGDVTAEFLLRHRKGKSVYLVGTKDLEEDFRKRGISLLSDDASEADIVVSSFTTDLCYRQLNTACRLLRGGAEFLATHPDFNCPTDKGPIPDSGANVAFIKAATGKDATFFGKPCRETIDIISEKTGFDKGEMCIFGDRLNTDIALGRRHGVTAILVLTGEATLEDVEKLPVVDRPDFIYPSLLEVNEAVFD